MLIFISPHLALGGLPWVFAFGGRWRLLNDALAGVPFVWRGDRTGVWATAPVAGAVLALWLCAALSVSTFLATLLCLAGAIAYPALIAWVEARYERLILLDLTVLETRFERITDTRAPTAEPRLIAASQLPSRTKKKLGSDSSSESEGGCGVGVRAADVTSKCRCGPVAKPVAPTGRPVADRDRAPGATVAGRGGRSGCAGRRRGRG